jgi:hypothetical protein
MPATLLVQVGFLILKLTGVLPWSWWLVFTPLWLWILSVLILVVLKLTEKTS